MTQSGSAYRPLLIGRWLSAVLFLLTTGCNSPQINGDSPQTDDVASVLLEDVSAFEMTSTHTGRTYHVAVYVPDGPAPTKGFPLLLMADGVWDFPTVVGTVRRMHQWDEVMPPVVVVGVGYRSRSEQAQKRLNDLCPVPVPRWAERLRELGRTDPPETGGNAAAFHAFVADELLPELERRLALDPSDRTILGHSAGGLFALFAAFHPEPLFRRFVAMSPALWWGDATTLTQEAEVARAGRTLSGRLFISIGGLEDETDPLFEPEFQFRMVSNTQRLADSLAVRDYPELDWTLKILPDIKHASAFAAALPYGLQFAFADNQ